MRRFPTGSSFSPALAFYTWRHYTTREVFPHIARPSRPDKRSAWGRPAARGDSCGVLGATEDNGTRLQIQAAELIEINNRLWEKEGFKVDFDPDRDTVTVSFGGIEHQLTLKRADPNVPMKMRHLSSTSAYDAGAAEPADDEEQMLRVELEEKVESYYQSANLVLKLLGRGRFPGMAKVRCQPISRVRNNLIEHAHEAGAYVYSFGVGSTGPRVKPSYQGKQVFNDDGLVPNTEAFVEAVVFGCRGIES